MTVPDDVAIGIAPEALDVPVDVMVVNAEVDAAVCTASDWNIKY